MKKILITLSALIVLTFSAGANETHVLANDAQYPDDSTINSLNDSVVNPGTIPMLLSVYNGNVG
jgi:hypothetical protein